MSIESILFKKSVYSRCKTILAHFSPCYQKDRSQAVFLGFKRFYSNHCSSYKTISVTPKVLLKAQVFGIKGQKFDERTLLANASSYY